jgi:DNA-binding SARP family transcriptional activator/RecA/RadA recombinase
MYAENAAIRISLLGKPALLVGDKVQPFGGPRKAIALLAYLLMHRDRVLLRATVAELFWPDHDDESARAALRRHLHRGLSALPAAAAERPWTIGDKATLRWNPDAALLVDVFEYERLSAEGRYDAAVALYRGDFLDGFHDDWALLERERIRELHSANLVFLLEERRRDLDYSAAIGYAQKLLRIDPLREDAVRRLMQLRYASGDRSGALLEFESFGRRLHDELAAEPMPETIALHETIRRNDVVRDGGPPAERRPAGLERAGLPFVGREAPFAALCRAWDAAAHGAGSTVVVSGEAGIGKSRLIAELVARAQSQGGRVAFGATTPVEAEPYQSVVDALRGALPILRYERIDPVKLAALSTLLPEVRDAVPDLPASPPLEHERERSRLFDALETALAQLAEKRPLLVVLEDLHWASSATIALIDFVARRLRGAPALIVVSFREEDVAASHALRAFVRGLPLQPGGHIALGPLGVDAVRALVAKVLARDDVTLADELHAGSEGSPLFIGELLNERLSGAGAAVPAGIVETVRSRVDRLTERARVLMETAAVAGTGFDAEVLRQVCGWSFAEVFDALDELVDGAIVREMQQRRGSYGFTHQLVHAAVYGMLDADVLRAVHRRVAKTLVAMFPDRAVSSAAIGRHFDLAELAAEAVPHYTVASKHASAVFAHSDAIALASRGLELATDARVSFELHRIREDAALRSGDVETRRDDCTAMRAIAETLGDEDLIGAALCKSIVLAWSIGDGTGEAAALAALRSLVERSGSGRWMVEARLAEARTEINRQMSSRAEQILADAEPHAISIAADLAFEYWILRAYAASRRDASDAPRFLDAARALASEDVLLQVRVLRVACAIDDRAGDYDALEDHAGQLLVFYQEFGDLEGQALAHQNLGIVSRHRFDLSGEREHEARALSLFERVQKPGSYASVLCSRGVFFQHTGAFDAAERDYLEAQRIAEGAGMIGVACLTVANLASLALFRGEYERALILAREALGRAQENVLDQLEDCALEYLGVAERELGRFEAAGTHLEQVVAMRRGRNERALLDTLIEIIPAYVALGKGGDAISAAEELLAGLRADRHCVTFPVHALDVAAHAFESTGNTERARALWAEGSALLLELAASISDDVMREGYVGLPFHRTARERGLRTFAAP